MIGNMINFKWHKDGRLRDKCLKKFRVVSGESRFELFGGERAWSGPVGFWSTQKVCKTWPKLRRSFLKGSEIKQAWLKPVFIFLFRSTTDLFNVLASTHIVSQNRRFFFQG